MVKNGNSKLIIIIAIIVGAAAVAAAAIVFSGQDDSDSTGTMTPPSSSQDLGDIVQIGSILPITGDLSTHGVEGKVTVELAVEDFNAYLDENTDVSWELDIAVEDTGSNPVNALEKLSSLNAKNIKFVVGPQSSAEVRNIKGYADTNGMLLISPSSTAPSLAIPGDNVYRLIPDDTKQGPALANLFADRGIEVVIPIWRGDAWGDGLTENTRESFTAMGGIMDEGIRYNPEAPEFSVSASVLAETVTGYSETHGLDRIGVLVISFAEVLPLMQSSSEHEILDEVAWFGSDGNTQEQKLVDDPIALEFSQTVGFTTTQVAFSDNPIHDSVKQRVMDKLGRVPNSYAFSSYDAVWLAGLSYLEAGSADIDDLKAALPTVASEYSGAIGSTTLNEAGDLATADYEIWTIRDAQWIVSDRYVTATGEIVPVVSESADVDDSMQAAAPMQGERVLIGSILPITGDLSTHGFEGKITVDLAVEDFNAYLDENTDAEWDLGIAVDDTGSNPVTALEKLSSLNAKNVKFVVGPQSSAEVRNIKGYADTNGMLLISPSSTAPSLAIPGDNVYRLIPDDTKQGPALANLFADRGIEAVIPIWRGDAWGDGLVETTRASFTGMDGIIDEGIRYNPESPELSVSVSVLNEKVAEYTELYGADNVGVLAVSFAEVLPLMQSASEHEILDEVAWFGTDGNTQEQKLIDDPIALEFSQTVGFTTTQVAFGDNPTYESVKERILDKLGRVPNSYAFSSYDAVWLAGLSYLEAGSTDIDDLKAALPAVASEYSGAIGSTTLNEAGDLATADYKIWTIRDGQWVVSDKYVTATGEIVPVVSESADMDDSMQTTTSIPGDRVLIGSILPITGDLSTHGFEGKITVDLAVEDFNAYLDENTDAEWDLGIAVDDTGSNPVTALEKLSSLNAKNVKFVVGPQSSAEVRNIKGYADTNGMLLISPSSTAPSLAIPGDNVYRLIPDDTKQGPAIATLFADRGIEAVIPIWRGDAWGDGLVETTRASFTGMDGIIDEGIRYNPESPELSVSVSVLNEKVAEYTELYGADNVGVLAVSFAEVLPLMQSASEHEILDEVAWFGTDGNTQEQKLIDDPIALEFSQTVGFTTTQVAFGDNPTYESVKERILDKLGRVPNSYAFSSYDAVWLAGLSYLEAGSTDIDDLKAALPAVASEYSGAIGSTTLNEAGDLATADYKIWTIRDGQWVVSDKYVTATGEIIPAS